jgi:hypothetical protein
MEDNQLLLETNLYPDIVQCFSAGHGSSCRHTPYNVVVPGTAVPVDTHRTML